MYVERVPGHTCTHHNSIGNYVFWKYKRKCKEIVKKLFFKGSKML
jgi:hypothetical protein